MDRRLQQAIYGIIFFLLVLLAYLIVLKLSVREQNQTGNLSLGISNLTPREDYFSFYQPHQEEPIIKTNKDFSYWMFNEEKCIQVICDCAKNTRTPCALFCIYCEELEDDTKE